MPIRILIADDYEPMRRALRTLIESHQGWEVCGDAEDGNEAVAKTAALSPDVVILDLSMPRMDGLEAARRIHETAPVPIILHTWYLTPAVERAAQVMGIYKVTCKSNTMDLFAELELLFHRPIPKDPLASPQNCAES